MMNNNKPRGHPFEPVADELPTSTKDSKAMSRRRFFTLTGGGLAVAFLLHDMVSFAGDAIGADPNSVPVGQVGAWLHIGEDGKVTVYTGKVEVGQNIRTSLSQVVSEELMVPMTRVEMIMGDTSLVPYDAGTYGSRTTPQMGSQLRKAAATARQALTEMAAKQWNTSTQNIKTEKGHVVHKTNGKRLSYGDLTKGKKLLMPLADDAPVVGVADWTVAGKTIPKVNGRSFINGTHTYVSDMKLPGMLYAKILRPPTYQATLVEVDTSKAQAMPGVVVVHDDNFVGVAAPDLRTATKALMSINAQWSEPGATQPSDKTVFGHLIKTSGGSGDRNAGTEKGDVKAGLAKAAKTLSSTFNIHYIAHVPLEPRAAVADWQDGKLTVWTGTQRPFGVQSELAELFKIDKEKVRVIMPDTGWGYGGKHTGEAALEAARLAQAAGKPVKVAWTREEEFTWAYFRPGGVVTVDAGVNKDGTITAWQFLNYNSGGSGLGTQYKVSSQQLKHLGSESPLRQGSYRGLASTANVFARESSMTDLARLINMDQLAFRLQNLDDDRFKAVLNAAAKSFGWNQPKAAKHGFGIAGGFEKGGYVGTCAEVMINNDKEVKVLRIVQAFECGAIINPHHLEQQVVGSIVQGLGGALFEHIVFADGKIKNSSLSAYRVPRFSDVPEIETILLDRKDLPSAGAGEAAIIGVAPAIRNAILDATGVALITLPMLPNGVVE